MANEATEIVPPRRQNVLPAISDDLFQRINALQELYQIDNKPMPFDVLMHRALDAFVQAQDKRNG